MYLCKHAQYEECTYISSDILDMVPCICVMNLGI